MSQCFRGTLAGGNVKGVTHTASCPTWALMNWPVYRVLVILACYFHKTSVRSERKESVHYSLKVIFQRSDSDLSRVHCCLCCWMAAAFQVPCFLCYDLSRFPSCPSGYAVVTYPLSSLFFGPMHRPCWLSMPPLALAADSGPLHMLPNSPIPMSSLW